MNIAASLSELDLAQFTGTENWYRHGLMPSIHYTDGVRHVAETANAYWLIDTIALSQPRMSAHPFQVWKLSVDKDRSARLRTTDGNNNLIRTKRLTFTDFPLSEIILWVSDKVILLPSEY